MPVTKQEIFENLMEPIKKELTESQWIFLISRGKIFIKQLQEIDLLSR